ncbi:hypothetical protein [Streptomyces sp. 11-1-2]|uniref:hypothetical protein n=1 Tax=unclassified Streptomyces TaxID=2593676 RepID=UPI000B8D286D|nr:hypothetical protein [Streptomyces sp. 11-1-2]ASQ95841.1 hypothetical protein CGL27_24720 [Streptomyces sp. 11-1-2]
MPLSLTNAVTRRPLVDELLTRPETVAALGDHGIRELADPMAYLGSARAMTHAVCGPSSAPVS